MPLGAFRQNTLAKFVSQGGGLTVSDWSSYTVSPEVEVNINDTTQSNDSFLPFVMDSTYGLFYYQDYNDDHIGVPYTWDGTNITLGTSFLIGNQGAASSNTWIGQANGTVFIYAAFGTVLSATWNGGTSWTVNATQDLSSSAGLFSSWPRTLTYNDDTIVVSGQFSSSPALAFFSVSGHTLTYEGVTTYTSNAKQSHIETPLDNNQLLVNWSAGGFGTEESQTYLFTIDPVNYTATLEDSSSTLASPYYRDYRRDNTGYKFDRQVGQKYGNTSVEWYENNKTLQDVELLPVSQTNDIITRHTTNSISIDDSDILSASFSSANILKLNEEWFIFQGMFNTGNDDIRKIAFIKYDTTNNTITEDSVVKYVTDNEGLQSELQSMTPIDSDNVVFLSNIDTNNHTLKAFVISRT